MTPPLPQDSATVWVVAARTARLTAALCAHLTSWLDDEERARLARFRFARDRLAYLMAHGLARWLLAGWQGIDPAQVRFERERYGKPVVAHARELAFSLSHTDGAVLCTAGHRGRLGADIEPLQRATTVADLVSDCCTAAERCVLAQLPAATAQETFLRWWTLKEAIMKADGRGLGIHPTAICCATTFSTTETASVRVPDLAGALSHSDCQCGVVKAWNSHWLAWCALTAVPITVQYWEWDGEASCLPLPLDEQRHFGGCAT